MHKSSMRTKITWALNYAYISSSPTSSTVSTKACPDDPEHSTVTATQLSLARVQGCPRSANYYLRSSN